MWLVGRATREAIEMGEHGNITIRCGRGEIAESRTTRRFFFPITILIGHTTTAKRKDPDASPS